MTSKISDPAGADAVAARRLLSADAVRQRAGQILALALDDGLSDWTVDIARLDNCADFVSEVVRQRYPQLDVPVHSRWRHFVIGDRDLWKDIAAGAGWTDAAARARAAFDLVITSVLLDAGAGAAWTYQDCGTDRVVSRSEGLALASVRWFERGMLSDNPQDPYRVDAAALRRVDLAAMEAAFQVGSGNPLLGVEGRVALLNTLGAVIESRPALFAIDDAPRPGGLFDAMCARAVAGHLSAATILDTLLDALGPLWQGRPTLGGVPLGDCWRYPALRGDGAEDGFVPLHKLSQWLAYSLVEPLEHAGITIYDMQRLTGLAEYRNGGLFVDTGVLQPRNAEDLLLTHPVASPFVVGWRSLTVALLDRLAPLVRSRLGLDPQRFPLGCMLEGGTWAAGRVMAGRRRTHGGPPFHIVSDGTVF